MRISTSWAQQLGVNAMNAQQVKMSKTQMQLSSGLNVLTPSDDPAAAVRTLSLQESIDKTTQYQDNIAMVRSRLNIEEGGLGTAENIMFRAKELTIQALNDTLTIQDRKGIKSEVDQLLQEMVGVANTKNANGEYIFSGDLSTTPAVAWDSEVGTYVYQGGMNQRVLDIAPERRVADGDLASNIFINIASVSQEANATVDGSEINTRSVFDTLQSLSFALEQKYEIPEAVISGDRFMKQGVNYLTPVPTPAVFNLTSDLGRTIEGATPLVFSPLNYNTGTGGTNAVFDIVVDGVNTETITLAADYIDQAALVADIEAQIAASATIAGLVEIDPTANPIQFKTVSTAANPTLQITETSGTFFTDAGFTNPVDQIAQPVNVILDQDYADLDAVVAAINSTPGLSDIGVQARSNGNQIEFISTTQGKESSVSIYDESPVNGTFLTDFGFASGKTGAGVDLGGTLTGTDELVYPVDYSVVNAVFELVDEADNKQQITLNGTYNNQSELVDAIQNQIYGSPIEGKIEIDPTANPIQFNSISSGTSAAVQISQVSGDFLNDNGFVDGDIGRVFSKTANDVLADLDSALDNFLKIRTTVGARMRALDNQEFQNEKFVVDMQTTLSDVRDLDYAEAISRFNLEQTALQAAQQAYSRVQNLSLFNFL